MEAEAGVTSVLIWWPGSIMGPTVALMPQGIPDLCCPFRVLVRGQNDLPDSKQAPLSSHNLSNQQVGPFLPSRTEGLFGQGCVCHRHLRLLKDVPRQAG